MSVAIVTFGLQNLKKHRFANTNLLGIEDEATDNAI